MMAAIVMDNEIASKNGFKTTNMHNNEMVPMLMGAISLSMTLTIWPSRSLVEFQLLALDLLVHPFAVRARERLILKTSSL